MEPEPEPTDSESGGLCDAETGPETDKRTMEPDAAHNRYIYIYEVIEDMDINTVRLSLSTLHI